MAKKSQGTTNPFAGSWHIVSMSAWDEDYLNEEVQAFIEFEKQGGGSFQFGYVQGQIDYRTTKREGKPAVEFSWEGGDGADGTPLTGRGWAILEGDELHGEFCIHEGEDSEFVAKKATARKAEKRK
jgi:hypothetical protein